MNLDQLCVTLMALLPAGGRPITVAQLAALAAVTKHEVVSALMPRVNAGQARYHAVADAFSCIKRGDAL